MTDETTNPTEYLTPAHLVSSRDQIQWWIDERAGWIANHISREPYDEDLDRWNDEIRVFEIAIRCIEQVAASKANQVDVLTGQAQRAPKSSTSDL